MKNKHLFPPAIAILLSMFCSGCGTFIGTTINITVSPEFDVNKYKRFMLDYDVEDIKRKVSFIVPDIDKVFKDYELTRIYHGDLNPGDMLVFVTGHKGFSLPPSPGPNLNLIYTHPRLVSVDIQDSITKKRLLLCVYKSGFFSMCSFTECMEMISEKLKKAFKASRKHDASLSPLATKEKSEKNDKEIK